MPRDPSFEPFRTFYAEGGYTGSGSSKKRLDMALWGSQNLAGGGQFLNWVRNLIDYANPTERAAINRAAEHARKTGNETYIVGPKSGPEDLSGVLQSYGNELSAPLPGAYGKFMLDAGRTETPVYSVHPHPSGTAGPSWGDLSVWANHPAVSALESATQDFPIGQRTPARQSMWIRGMSSGKDTDLAHVEPAPKDLTKRYELQRNVDDLYMRRGQQIPAIQHATNQVALDVLPEAGRNYLKFLSPKERGEALWGIRQAYQYDKLGEAGLPLYFDPNMLVSKNLPYTAGDVWPEFLRALKFEPYADGGAVPGYAGGGKFGALRNYAQMIGALSKSGYGRMFKAADESLPHHPADAVSAFTGFPVNALEDTAFLDRGGFGLMYPYAFERPEAVPDFSSFKDLLRAHYGDRIPLARVEQPLRGSPDPRRQDFSWTSDPEFAEHYAGVRRVPSLYDEKFIQDMERMYDLDGVARISKGREVRREGAWPGGPDYPNIYEGGQHITDTDSVRHYMTGINEDRLAAMAENERRRERIKFAPVDVNDLLWATDRGGQSEFIVRYPWGKYADGGFVAPDESRPMPPFQLAYGSQFFNEGGPVLHKAADSIMDALNKIGGTR